MDASILDLRYKMREVLKALSRREKVRILYHGKIRGEIVPPGNLEKNKTVDHPIFGMLKSEKEDPVEIVNKLRSKRYHDL